MSEIDDDESERFDSVVQSHMRQTYSAQRYGNLLLNNTDQLESDTRMSDQIRKNSGGPEYE